MSSQGVKKEVEKYARIEEVASVLSSTKKPKEKEPEKPAEVVEVHIAGPKTKIHGVYDKGQEIKVVELGKNDTVPTDRG